MPLVFPEWSSNTMNLTLVNIFNRLTQNKIECWDQIWHSFQPNLRRECMIKLFLVESILPQFSWKSRWNFLAPQAPVTNSQTPLANYLMVENLTKHYISSPFDGHQFNQYLSTLIENLNLNFWPVKFILIVFLGRDYYFGITILFYHKTTHFRTLKHVYI